VSYFFIFFDTLAILHFGFIAKLFSRRLNEFTLSIESTSRIAFPKEVAIFRYLNTKENN